jgi:NAD(P)-dependent dehydrogenase (short-subunit alcohol dehydrogenase family)
MVKEFRLRSLAMTDLTGKCGLVTGGTKGIGLAIARVLAEAGSSIFICARNEKEVGAVVDRLSEEYPGRVSGARCDVRNYDDVRETVARAGDVLGGLDILVNNAGIGEFVNVEEMDAAKWDATIGTNLSGVFYCCREAIPLMKRRGGGYIINIGSLAGKNAFPGGAAYNASKFGLIGFSEALMQEVRYAGIRVSYVMPGSVNTDFGRSGAEDAAQTWKLTGEDVAAVVLDILKLDPRALASRVEIRPSQPRK